VLAATRPHIELWRGSMEERRLAASTIDHQALAVLLGLNGLRVSEACETNVEDLAVAPGEVVDAADGWLAADGGVAAVMVVGVEPAVEASAAFGL
jgi:hypothetical protein